MGWLPLFLTVWFLGSCAGTAFAVLLVRGGSMKRAPRPDPAARDDREKAA